MKKYVPIEHTHLESTEYFKQQEESARERALCQLTECFWFVKVIRGQNNYQEKGCTEIQ